MAAHTDSKLRALRGARAVRSASSSSTAAGQEHEPRATESMGDSLFDGVSAAVRMQMQLVARASASPATALPAIIALIVDGSSQKRAAIISAIEETPPLREQWERTWAVLRR
jgi:hypothetical protein